MEGCIKLEQDGKIWIAVIKDNTATYSWAKSATSKWQEQSNEFKVGKNIGKANETTSEAQAKSELESLVELYRAKKYREIGEEIDENDLPLPMLAKKFKDQKKKIVYPAFIQPKFDGYRCLYNSSRGLPW